MADSVSEPETAPLLHNADQVANQGLPRPAVQSQVQDHPAFLRVCHSPWRWLPQNILSYIRGTILAYLVATGSLVLAYKVEEESPHSAWRILFEFESVSFVLALLYHTLAFSWTFTHLFFPYIDEHRSGWQYTVLRAMSLPRNMASLRSQFCFSLFYFVTTVFALVNAIIYWSVTLLHNDTTESEAGLPSSRLPSPEPLGPRWPGSPSSPTTDVYDPALGVPSTWGEVGSIGKTSSTDIFDDGWLRAFVYLNLFAITAAIAVVEVFFFNSIKRPLTVGTHILGLLLSSGLYLGWAAVGKVVTGAYAFHWLDEDNVGSREAVVANSVGFVLLSPIILSLVYGVIAIREAASKSASPSRTTAAPALLADQERDE